MRWPEDFFPVISTDEDDAEAAGDTADSGADNAEHGEASADKLVSSNGKRLISRYSAEPPASNGEPILSDNARNRRLQRTQQQWQHQQQKQQKRQRLLGALPCGSLYQASGTTNCNLGAHCSWSAVSGGLNTNCSICSPG